MAATLAGTLPDLVIIPPTKTSPGLFWGVVLDVVVLADGGDVADAVALASHLALRDTRVPKTTLVQDPEGPTTFELDPEVSRATWLDPSQLCLSATVHVVGEQVIVDASAEEEACADTSVTVRVGRDGAIRSVNKREGGALSPELLTRCISTAATVARELVVAVEAQWSAGSIAGPSDSDVAALGPVHDGGASLSLGTRVTVSRR